MKVQFRADARPRTLRLESSLGMAGGHQAEGIEVGLFAGHNVHAQP